MAINSEIQPKQLPSKGTKTIFPPDTQRKFDEVNEALLRIDAQKLYALMKPKKNQS